MYQIRRLLTCYDIRIEKERLAEITGLSYRTIGKYHEILRDLYLQKKLYASHNKRIEAFGLEFVIAEMPKKFVKDVYKVKRIDKLNKKYPYVRFTASAFMLNDDKCYAFFRIPKKYFKEVFKWIEKDAKGVWKARTLPVYACNNLYNLEELFRKASKHIVHHSRDLLIDALITSVLDLNPLAGMKSEDFNIAGILKRRLDIEFEDIARTEPSLKYIRRHYHELSKKMIIGRVFLFPPEKYHVVTLVAKNDRFFDTFALAVLGVFSNMIFVARENGPLIATFTIPEPVYDEVSFRLKEIGAGKRLKMTAFAPFPIELVNPFENDWSLEPLSPEVIKRYNIYSRKKKKKKGRKKKEKKEEKKKEEDKSEESKSK